MKELLEQSKKGVASLYIVIFATILFGVITLSFVRITVSELSQTNDSDLSQSAYDAALAGVEDAKVLVNRYYTLVKNGAEPNPSDYFNDDCFTLSRMLYDYTDGGGEVPIQESGEEGQTNSANQAYTCVTLSNKVADYKFTLNPESRVHVVPLAVDNDAGEFDKVEFSWYTEKNGTKLSLYDNDTAMPLFGNKNNATIPPALTLGVIVVGAEVDIDNLSKKGEQNFFTVALVPSSPDYNKAVTEISDGDLQVAANIETENVPFGVKCEEAGQNQEYACSVNLNIKNIKELQAGANGNAYLVVGMPYGAVETDCKVVKLTESGNVAPFKDTQIKVDSTGRAADLYRRVEVRLSAAAKNFPFPQFELDLSGPDGAGNSDLQKNLWVTKNCWGTNCSNSGQL